MQPRSSSRKTTTTPRPARSTASIAATTPSAPSNLPPYGTESRCEPVQTLGSAAAADQVAGAVHLDLEPGLLASTA